MAYTEQQARQEVLAAGHRLVELGLIARTWGNISARISQTQFLITPSGLAYETLRPEQLVVVNIADCSYTGSVKPSSEKGVHAAAYQLHPEVDFVIHTHQDAASLAGVAGHDLTCDGFPVLGDCVPCAGYGIPSTKKLCSAVSTAMEQHPGARAVLMPHHGTLCLGKNADEAFAVAQALEARCADMGAVQPMVGKDWGESIRQKTKFCLRLNGEETTYLVGAKGLPPVAWLHSAIYAADSDLNCILRCGDAPVVGVSALGQTLRPMLDDLAQIAGVTVRCANPARPEDVVGKLRGRNAVLLRGAGALCTGKTVDDTEAVCQILTKECRVQLYAKTEPNCRPLGWLDAKIQRVVYCTKYSKQKQ